VYTVCMPCHPCMDDPPSIVRAFYALSRRASVGVFRSTSRLKKVENLENVSFLWFVPPITDLTQTHDETILFLDHHTLHYSYNKIYYSITTMTTLYSYTGGETFEFSSQRTASAVNVMMSSSSTLGVGNEDLQRVFPNKDDLVHALKHRFDVLPLHKLCYDHSSYPASKVQKQLQNLLQLLRRLDRVSRILLLKDDNNSSSNSGRQDAFGMTPLHILALSKVHRLEMYQAILRQYPEDLITQDKWGAYPIHYACRCDAPFEIIHLLIQTQRIVFWKHKLGLEMTLRGELYGATVIRNVIKSTIAGRLEYFGLVHHCNTAEEIPIEQLLGSNWNRIKAQVDISFVKLKKMEVQENIVLLELALWKHSMNECVHTTSLTQKGEQKRKRIKIDQVTTRGNCRASCQYDNIMRHVLPFLRTVKEKVKEKVKEEKYGLSFDDIENSFDYFSDSSDESL
jgi:hypothetical protein